MSPSLLHKVCRALTDLPRSLRPTPHPRLIMTLLVKNEEEMLEQNLLFHKRMGVDGFIITDNNSTDRTPQIIEKYRQRGWVVEVIKELRTDYAQKQWVDRMVWLAKTKYGADWVINADADEFWLPNSRDFKAVFSSIRGNILLCGMRNVYPEEGKPWTEWGNTVHPIKNCQDYDLPLYHVFGEQKNKVAHRTDGYLQISMGNHKVAMFPSRKREGLITIYHYNVRTKAAFIEKMVKGGRTIEQRKSRHGGRHWRHFYQLYKEGRLEEEYDRIIGRTQYDRLISEGFICKDNPLPALFQDCPE